MVPPVQPNPLIMIEPKPPPVVALPTLPTCEGNTYVLPSTTTAVADEARETVVPETVMAGPPGARLWLLIM